MEIEIWKDVVNYEGIYQVSNLGRVKTLKKISYRTYEGGIKRPYKEAERIKKTCINPKTGYVFVGLSNNIKYITPSVHRLVALAFIPNPENKPEVNHINGIKTDNRLINLEWVTISENIKHAYRIGLLKPNKTATGKTGILSASSKPVIRIDADNQEKRYDSISDALRDLNKKLSKTDITNCLRSNKGTAFGYKWKYA